MIESIFSQKDIVDKFRPLLEAEGLEFRKVKKIFAKCAAGGEQISTITRDGLETTNTAHAGDFIVRNQTAAGEMYIVPADKFARKYVLLQSFDDGFDEYQSIGKIIAIELTPERLAALELPEAFQFTARWGEPMQAKAGDYLATNHAYDEIYRIARLEFFETYQPSSPDN